MLMISLFLLMILTKSTYYKILLQDEILPWFEKKEKEKKKKKKKRKLPLRVLNSKLKVGRSRISSAQNFRLQ